MTVKKFTDLTQGEQSVQGAGWPTMYAIGIGSVGLFICTLVRRLITVNDILFVPNLRFNLILVKQLCRLQFEVAFTKEWATVTRTSEVRAMITHYSNLYVFQGKNSSESRSNVAFSGLLTRNTTIWHR